MEELYTQCLLTNTKTLYSQIAWIQSSIAKKNKVITLKDEEGYFLVEETYPPQLDWKTLNERGQDYKRTRNASDI